MSFLEKLRRLPPIWWIVIFSLALVLPRLGSFGFWDPWELKIAEHARDMASSDSLFDVTVNKRFTAEPPLDLVLAAVGMRIFSVGEFGGRIGNALCAILALLAVYWAGRGLFRRRAAVLSALVLGSFPLFVLEARQLVSDMPLVAGLALALGGLGRYAWPPDGKRRARDLVIAGVGLVMGLLAGGAMLGVALPALAMAGALLVGYGLRPSGGQDGSAAVGGSVTTTIPVIRKGMTLEEVTRLLGAPLAGGTAKEALGDVAGSSVLKGALDQLDGMASYGWDHPAGVYQVTVLDGVVAEVRHHPPVGAGQRVSRATGAREESSGLCAPGIGPDVAADVGFGQGLFVKGARGRAVLLTIAVLGLAVFVWTLVAGNVAGKFSLLLGGVPRAATPTTTYEYLLKQLGFGLFPWSALAVFALGRPLIRLGGGGEPDGNRLAFCQLYLLVFAAFGFALSSLFVIMTGEARFVALAPIALAVGALLDEALEGERAEPVLGLLVATGTMVVARDFVLEPAELVSVHTLARVTWPSVIKMGPTFMAIGVLFAAGIYTGFATRGRALGKVALRDLGKAGTWRRRIERAVVEAGRWGIQVAVASAVVFALVVGLHIVPTLSKHLSFKPLLESYKRFAAHGERIGRYKVEAQGAGFYSKKQMIDLPSLERVADFLRSPDRVFVLVAANETGPLDANLKTARVNYYVVDASSSRFLLLSNRLDRGEQDQNPLKKDVWMAPQLPRMVTVEPSTPGGEPVQKSEWPEQPAPWKWRIPMHTMFEDAIELVGADYPPTIRRPGSIPLTLYFRVHKKPKPGFRLFVHFDSPNEPRILGDHALLNGVFPTDYWLPGEYIRDTYEVEVPLMTTPAGRYTLLIGFWPGGEGKRLKITSGHNDGGDRTQVGTIEIK